MESQKKFNFVWVLVALVLGFFALMMLRPSATSNPTSNTVQQPAETTQTGTEEMIEQTTEPTESTGETKEFTVTASDFTYDVKEIRVKKGDTVKIVFNNADGFHDFNVDEFNAKTKVIGADATETITFVADKAGEFEYYCSVGQHRAMGMKGKLIVE